MTTYCDWSDLPSQECQHCQDGKKVIGNPSREKLLWGDVETETYSGPSRVFQAKFPGKCGSCGQTIQIGQDIYMGNGAPIHAGE